MRRLILLPALVVTLGLMLVAPVSASTTRTSYACEERLSGELAESTITIENGVLLARGGAFVYDVTGDALCAGTLTVRFNFNLDLGDWSGAMWGTATSELAAYDGGFVQSFTAHWLVPDPLNAATDIFDGQYVGHGYGDLAGWQSRGVIYEATHVLITDTGFAFVPGD